jgi:hypothetical protein
MSVTGSGAIDNAKFKITGNELSINASPDYESQSSYSILVRTTDQLGASYERVIVLPVTDINDLPTLNVDPVSTIYKDTAGNDIFTSVSGLLSVSDPDFDDSATYGITGGTEDGHGTVSKSGNYGTLTVHTATGEYAFTPDEEAIAALTANASETFELTVTDSANATDRKIFTVNVTAVNDAPSFIASNPPTNEAGSGAITIPNWATFNPGGNETNQTATYIVSGVVNPTLFAVAPSVDSTGTLTYTLAPSKVGSATFNVTVRDDGGIAQGGVNISAPQTFSITVGDVTPPTVITKDITVQLDASGTASIAPAAIDNDSFDNVGITSLSVSQSVFTGIDLGTKNVLLTATDANANSATGIAKVTVKDNLAPLAQAQNLTVQLDDNGNATISAAQINNGSTDNVGIQAFSLNRTTFTGADLGTKSVVLTVTDASGNSASTTATVTVKDHLAPIAVTKNIELLLGSDGTATVTAADINNGSSDNVAISSYSLDQTSFNQDDLGANTVTLTVTDTSGNSATATAIVTVSDTIAPIAIAKNLTVQLDAQGQVSLTPAQIDNGSRDNVGVASLRINPASFDDTDLGPNAVTLTVIDTSGNSATATAMVTVQDLLAPLAVAKNITLPLNAEGTALISPADIDNGSRDNASIQSLSLSQTSFTGENLGENTVTLTATDTSGNSATATATVTVQDLLAPLAVAKNITLPLNAEGMALITPADIDNGSNDNVGIQSLSLSQTSFSMADLGTNAVTLTVTDTSGNSATTTASVTVLDVIPPAVPTVVSQLTNDSTPVLTGTADADTTVTVAVGGAIYSTTAPDGTWTIDTAISTPTAGTFTPNLNGANEVSVTSTDLGGNRSNDTTSNELILDTTAPTVTAIRRRTPSRQRLDGDSATFTLLFSETVQEIDLNDFALYTTGTATGTLASVSAATGNSVTVTITNLDGVGRLGVNVPDTAIASDAVGNRLRPFSSGETYTLAPAVMVFTFAQYMQYQSMDDGILPTFDEEMYCLANPDIAAAIEHGWITSGTQHYQVYGQAEGRTLLPLDLEVGNIKLSAFFDEIDYLSRNPDVAAAVAQGVFSYGFEHFLLYGLAEGRSPSAYYDEAFYLAHNPDGAAAVQSGHLSSGLAHFLNWGHREMS